MLTGERSLAGQTYLVRDVYFEPALGHAPQRLVDGLLDAHPAGTRLPGRNPSLQFPAGAGCQPGCARSRPQGRAGGLPGIAFSVAARIGARDPATAIRHWIEMRWLPRLAAWRARLDEIPRFRRVAQLSGLIWPLAWLERQA